jgi:FkbM family methyltransferase
MDETSTIFLTGLPSRPVEFRFSDGGRRDYVATLVRDHGLAAYEAGMPRLIAWFVGRQRGIMLDVGANTGLFSLLAAAANPAIKVCAFEPLASVRDLLHANLALNPLLASRVSVYSLGLSDRAGTLEFYETINKHALVPTSSSLELAHVEEIGHYKKHNINVDTLDNWSSFISGNAINVIKIDVEGHEDAVLLGGRKTIQRHRPFITIEVLSPSRVHVIKMILNEINYLDFVITPDALRHCDEVHHHGDGWNHLLCPAECAAQILQACRELDLRLVIA